MSINTSNVIKQILKFRDLTQRELADKAGYKSQSNITGLLNQGDMRLSGLIKMVEALDCELIVRDKKGTSQEWIITEFKDEK